MNNKYNTGNNISRDTVRKMYESLNEHVMLAPELTPFKKFLTKVHVVYFPFTKHRCGFTTQLIPVSYFTKNVNVTYYTKRNTNTTTVKFFTKDMLSETCASLIAEQYCASSYHKFKGGYTFKFKNVK